MFLKIISFPFQTIKKRSLEPPFFQDSESMFSSKKKCRHRDKPITINALPDEILFRIFQLTLPSEKDPYETAIQWHNIGGVCKLWNTLSKNDWLWTQFYNMFWIIPHREKGIFERGYGYAMERLRFIPQPIKNTEFSHHEVSVLKKASELLMKDEKVMAAEYALHSAL